MCCRHPVEEKERQTSDHLVGYLPQATQSWDLRQSSHQPPLLPATWTEESPVGTFSAHNTRPHWSVVLARGEHASSCQPAVQTHCLLGAGGKLSLAPPTPSSWESPDRINGVGEGRAREVKPTGRNLRVPLGPPGAEGGAELLTEDRT